MVQMSCEKKSRLGGRMKEDIEGGPNKEAGEGTAWLVWGMPADKGWWVERVRVWLSWRILKCH